MPDYLPLINQSGELILDPVTGFLYPTDPAIGCNVCCDNHGTCLSLWVRDWNCSSGMWGNLSAPIGTVFNTSNVSTFTPPTYNTWIVSGCSASYRSAVASTNGVDCTDPDQPTGAPTDLPPDLSPDQITACCGKPCPCPEGCPCCLNFPAFDNPSPYAIRCCYGPDATLDVNLSWDSSFDGSHSVLTGSGGTLDLDSCEFTIDLTLVVTGGSFPGTTTFPGYGMSPAPSIDGSEPLEWTTPTFGHIPGDCQGVDLTDYDVPGGPQINVNGTITVNDNEVCAAGDVYDAP